MSAWVAIIKKALTDVIESTQRPVTGAKLRQEVARVAADWSVEFPPPEMTKFSSFVESFDKDFIVHRVPGSDVLVAPADRADLFAAAVATSPTNYSRMRQDLFKALTTIRSAEHGRAVYLPADDGVKWLQADDGEAPQDSVFLPSTSLGEEVGLRRDFAESLEDQSAGKIALVEALKKDSPLRSFTLALQEFGLVRQWHLYRLRFLATKLREWSVANAVQWQPSWVTTNEPRNLPRPTLTASMASQSDFSGLVGQLSDDELKRIMVPLDIVLRLIAQR
jgi:hypothetical protein